MGRLKEVLTGTIGKCFLICDVCYFSVDFSQSVWPEKRGGIGKEAKERPSFEPIAGPHRFSKLINCTSIEILYMLYLSSETVLEVQENPNIVRHEWSPCASSRPWAGDGFPGVFKTFVLQIHKYTNTNMEIQIHKYGQSAYPEWGVDPPVCDIYICSSIVYHIVGPILLTWKSFLF